MENTVNKGDNTKLIAALAIASFTAGAIAFLYFTDKGRDARKALQKKVKTIATTAAVEAISKKNRIKKQAATAAANHAVEAA